MKFKSTRLAFIAVALLVSARNAKAEISLLDQNQFKFTVSGFIEADGMYDTTRSYKEIIGNNAIQLPGTPAGKNGRTQFTIRNSRLAFNLAAPEINDWKTFAYMEFDFLGYNAASSGNSEASLYSSPNIRVRHAYLQGSKGGFQFQVGQYWQLLGWQPYYFFSSDNISPLPGMLYSRTEQARALETIHLGGENDLTVAGAILRPPQEDSSMPDFQAGARLTMASRQSGFTGSSAGKRRLMPMSVAVSGAYRQFAIPSVAGGSDLDRFNGYAFAANAFVPILAADDKKSVSNTLSLMGEFSAGSGDGDQFSGWTGNYAQPLSTATNGTALNQKIGLDAGLGDFDSAGNFHLVKLMSYNLHLQYHLPYDLPDFVEVGAGELSSSNANSLVGSNGKTSAGSTPYNRVRGLFVNYFHDFTANLRTGVEYVYSDTLYGSGQTNHNSRYQASAFYLF